MTAIDTPNRDSAEPDTSRHFVAQLPADHVIDGINVTELAIAPELFRAHFGGGDVAGWWLDPGQREVGDTNQPIQLMTARLPEDAVSGEFTLAFSLLVRSGSDAPDAVPPGSLVTVQAPGGGPGQLTEPRVRLAISPEALTPGEICAQRETVGFGPPSPGYSSLVSLGPPDRWLRVGLVMGCREMKIYIDGVCVDTNGVPVQGFPSLPGIEVIFGLMDAGTGPAYRVGEVRIWSSALPEEALARDAVRAGAVPEEYTELAGQFNENVAVARWEPSGDPALYLVEHYRMSIVPAAAGLGKVAKTLTLLPGEEVTTFVSARRTDIDKTADRTSVLDSMSRETAEVYQRDVQTEREQRMQATSASSVKSGASYSVAGSASASWGWGRAQVSSTVSGSVEASRSASAVREEMARAVNSVSARSAQRANSQRDVTVEIVKQAEKTTDTLESAERLFKNPSSSRTMTAVFRQVNQRYVTFLHLVDIRIGYAVGVWSRETTLDHLDELLADVLVAGDENRKDPALAVRALLRDEYADISTPALAPGVVGITREGGPFLEEMVNGFAVSPDARQVAVLETGASVSLPGALVDLDSTVLMTDGVVAECVLGETEVFDLHAHEVAAEMLDQLRISNELLHERITLLGQKDLPLQARLALLLALPGVPEVTVPAVDGDPATDGGTSGEPLRRPATRHQKKVPTGR